MTFPEMVAAERKKQIEDKGYTPEHDDTHREGELAGLAAYHTVAAVGLASGFPYDEVCEKTDSLILYPFDDCEPDIKPSALENIVIAAASLQAEAERIMRAEIKNAA